MSSPVSSSFRSTPRAMRRFLLEAVTVCVCTFLPLHAQAQAKAAPHHIIEGHVVNAANAPVVGAVVYLENPKSLDVQSYLTDEKGYFHFNQITAQTDYNVWAEQNGVETKHKFVSQFSSHVHFNMTLKLIPEKKKKFLGIF